MSLVSTLTQPLRQKYAPKTLDRNVVRHSRYGAWDFFQQQTNLQGGVMTDAVKNAIKTSNGNTVVIPVLNADNVTIGNVRSCVIPSMESTSALVTLTGVTYAFGFTMAPAQYKNNDIAYQDDFNHKLEQYLLKFANVLDAAAVAQLNTNRNQYFPAAISAYYPSVGNSLQVTAAQRDDFFNQLQSIHTTMDYYGAENIIGSASLGAITRRLMAQGDANAVNQDFQFDPYRWITTNRIVPATGVQATLFAVPDGNVAVTNRNDRDAQMKSNIGNIKVWGESQVPIVNMNMGTYYTQDCADMSTLNTGTTDMTATKVEGFLWSTDVFFMTSYQPNPTTDYGPILKAEISAT